MRYVIPCPRSECDEPTKDGLLCRTDTSRLTGALNALPEYFGGLHVDLTRQSKGAGGGKSSIIPMPFGLSASDARVDAVNTVGTWIRCIAEDYGEDIAKRTLVCVGHACVVVSEAIPGRTMDAWASWLLERLYRIRGHQAVAQIYDELLYAVDMCKRTIDRPADREFLGTCDICGHNLFAKPGAAAAGLEVACKECAKLAGPKDHVPIYDARDRRQYMRDEFRDRLASAQEILAACPSIYGVPINTNTFYSWVSRGLLAEHGPGRYKVGEALDLAIAAAEKKRRVGKQLLA